MQHGGIVTDDHRLPDLLLRGGDLLVHATARRPSEFARISPRPLMRFFPKSPLWPVVFHVQGKMRG
jgi:hypothetical protein